MFQMFKQFFMAFTVLFSAFEKTAKSLDNLASVGEEMSEGFLMEERIKRQGRLAQLRSELAMDQQKQITA
jgi:hypothetical protein